MHRRNAKRWINVSEESGSGAALGTAAVRGCWAPPERTARDEVMKMTPDRPSPPRGPRERHCSWKTVVASPHSPKRSSPPLVCS